MNETKDHKSLVDSAEVDSFIAKQKLSVINEDLMLPAAVIYESGLKNNIQWMQAYANNKGVMLAPHGKTTMTPDLFQAQIDAGAWGMTLATAEQVAIGYQHGIKRVLMANQLVGKGNMEMISRIIEDAEVEFYCLVDSLTNISQLDSFFSAQKQKLNLLIEIGPKNARCGCNDLDVARELALAIKDSEYLNLAGIEFYEGVLPVQEEVDDFLTVVSNIFDYLHDNSLFTASKNILSGAGSAWYDRVSQQFASHKKEGVTYLIRPGCYLTHDHGIYESAQNQVLERDLAAQNMPTQLESSLEVWAYVLSTPVNGDFAIAGLGKRDAAYDAGLPIPKKWYRPGWKEPKNLEHTTAKKIMDQHIMLEKDSREELKPGDMIGFATSHPCLTFDKWTKVHLVDDDLNVLKVMKTVFRIEG